MYHTCSMRANNVKYAIEYNSPELCKLLLHAGADPYLEDKMQR